MLRLRTDILSLLWHLMGQNKSVSPDSRMGNRLHFSWEELPGCVAEGMNSGKGIIGAIFAINLPQTATLTVLENPVFT